LKGEEFGGYDATEFLLLRLYAGMLDYARTSSAPGENRGSILLLEDLLPYDILYRHLQ
jgi:hypothetical protein